MHLTDEQFTSYLLGAPDADVREHLERCADCRTEAHLLSETVLQLGDALRSEAARTETHAMERTAARSPECQTTERPCKKPLVWALAPMLATILVALGLFFLASTGMVKRLRQGPSASVPSNQSSQSPLTRETDGSTPHTSQSQTMVAANQTSTSQDDDALLRSIQEDASREVPAALEPAVVIVDERDRIAELRNGSTNQR